MKPGMDILVEQLVSPSECGGEEGKMVLVCKDSRFLIDIVGASMRTSVTHRYTKFGDNHRAQAVTIFPVEGHHEVLAVTIGESYYLLSIPWNVDDRCHVFDPDNRFCPDKLWFLQLYRSEDKFLTLEGGMGEEVYTSNPDDHTKRYVAPDLLCQLMASKIELDDLRIASEEAEEEASVREQVVELQKKLDAVTDELGGKLGKVRAQLKIALKDVGEFKAHIRFLAAGVMAYFDSQLFRRIRNYFPSSKRSTLREQVKYALDAVKPLDAVKRRSEM